MRALLLVVLAASLLPPPVSAGGSAHVRGDLDTTAPPALLGALDVRAAQGVVDLSAAFQAGERVNLSWAAADGEETHVSWIGVDNPVMGLRSQPPTDPDVRPTSLPAGRLLSITCGPKCRVFAAAEKDGDLRLQGLAGGAVARLEHDLEVCPVVCHEQGLRPCPPACSDPGKRGIVIPHGDFVLGGNGTPIRDATLRGAGRLTLLVTDADLVFGTPGEPQHLDVLTHERVAAGPGPAARARSYDNGYAWLVLEGAALETGPGTRAALYAPEARATLDGTLALDHATGTLEVDGRSTEVRMGRVLVEGVGDVDLSDARRGSLPALSEPTRTGVRLDASATRVEVDGAPLALDEGGAARAARDATLAALALAVLLILAKTLAWPLYTRLSPATVLRNPNRVRVYEMVRAQRPATVSGLKAATGLARVVLQHHLRMLEVHGFIARRRRGSANVYFAAEHAPPASDPAWATLSDLTRRGVAATLAGAPSPLTQIEVAAASGVSRRLASYHLDRLRRADLVRVEPGTPHRYTATPRLRGLLETG
jgi:predicted transcriptional regulator